MGKITYIKIAGKNYPMSFSLMASKKLAEKYGNVESVLNKANSEKGVTADFLETISDITELLIQQGCAYKNYFEKNVPTKPDDPVENGTWVAIPKEAIEIAMGIGDFEEFAQKLTECINGGKTKEVEAKPTEKNIEAGQE